MGRIPEPIHQTDDIVHTLKSHAHCGWNELSRLDRVQYISFENVK